MTARPSVERKNASVSTSKPLRLRIFSVTKKTHCTAQSRTKPITIVRAYSASLFIQNCTAVKI